MDMQQKKKKKHKMFVLMKDTSPKMLVSGWK